MSAQKIRVAILDSHQSIIDGYFYRLQQHPEVTIVGAATSGLELEELLARNLAEVVILGLNVPTTPTNLNPYPVVHAIPKLLQQHPGLAVLVITSYSQQTLIKTVLEAGARGYVLKDDLASIKDLPLVVVLVGRGGIYLSQQAYMQLLKYLPHSEEPQLTPRQLEVISLCAAYPGTALSDLAPRLGISDSTLRNLLTSVYARLGAANRHEAILKARELGLITPIPPVAPDLAGRGE